MFGFDLVLGLVSGSAVTLAIGLIPACRKFMLGFVLLLVVTQLYLEGIAGYQQWVGDTLADLAQHKRFTIGLIGGAVAGLLLTLKVAARRRPSS